MSAGYEELSALDGFAWEWAQQHAGRREVVERLVGFCLLISREVIERVGLLDERFGLGNFEDDDYCRRAAQAGFRLVIAGDAFVHHFGHRSFEAAGVDLGALLQRNQRLFDEKWGAPVGPVLVAGRLDTDQVAPALVAGSADADAALSRGLATVRAVADGEHDAGDLRSGDWQGREALPERAEGIGDREQGTETLATPAVPCPLSRIPCSLSLCMIVRDNEHTIRPCLESIRPWTDEMIVVDTGSRDATPEICRELGARVEQIALPDSFAEARNESLKYARGEWIFWMDSDDVIDADNGRKLRELARRPAPENLLGYTIQVRCPGPGEDGAYDVTVVDHCKLFRNRPDLRFEGRIHEQMLSAINRAGGDVLFTDLFVVHAGADHTPEGRRRKLRRDLRLLRLERRERPDHTFVHFNLGMTYADAGKHAKAVAALVHSRELARPHESHVRKVYALLVAGHRELGQRAEAWRACREGLFWYPKDPELLFREGILAHEDGRLREAELAYLGALANEDAVHFGSIDRGIVGFKARQNLAAVYADMGEPGRAEEQWRAIVAEAPGYRAGWQGLVDNLIAQGKLAEAQSIAARLTCGEARLRGTGMALAARVAEAAGDLSEARDLLRRGVAECCDDVAPLEELCRLLFEHGPPDEAEAALRELARRRPADGAAPHNLGTLLLRGGNASGAVEAFRASLARRPGAAVTHLSLGYALCTAGVPGEAAAAFREGLRLAPDDRLAAEAQRQLMATPA